MEVKFWRYFDKKELSTARPSKKPDYIADIKPYQPCSMTNPKVKLAADTPRFYYAYFTDFGRYYYLQDISYEGVFQICTYAIDILATYRTDIFATSAMIERSAQKSNGDLADLYRMTDSGDRIINNVSSDWFRSGSGYLVQFVGANGYQNLWIQDDVFKEFMQVLWKTWGNITDITDVLVAAVDPSQYITSVKKCMIGYDAFIDDSTPEVPIVIGNLPLISSITGPLKGFKLYDNITKTVTISIPKHPMSVDFPFLKGSRYSSYSIKIPGAGWVDLNAEDLYHADSLNIVVTVDNINGKMRNTIKVGTKTIAEVMGQGVVNYSLSTGTANLEGVVGGIATAGIGALTMNPAAVIGGVGSALGSVTNTITARGGQGSAIGADDKPEIVLRYLPIEEVDVENQGRPLMQVAQIGSFRGYVKCSNANPVLNGATKQEHDEVKSLLNGGIFVE